MDEVAEWIGPSLEQRGNVLDVDVGAGDLVSDRLMVWQILLNLLANANKFTENGTLCLEAHDGAMGVVLRVTDEGIGMTADELRRVRVPFQQANTRIVAVYGGTGLGLALVERFVEALGGTLSLESTKGEGTVATVVLPNSARPSSGS